MSLQRLQALGQAIHLQNLVQVVRQFGAGGHDRTPDTDSVLMRHPHEIAAP